MKSNDVIKGFSEMVYNADNIPRGEYQISQAIDIDSEYRVFVFRDEIYGIHYYAGDVFKFPSVRTIKIMVEKFEQAPAAYTLDVGVNSKETLVVEAHDFFSCGLYGFSNYNILPQMFSSWFYQYIRENS